VENFGLRKVICMELAYAIGKLMPARTNIPSSTWRLVLKIVRKFAIEK